jgi:hypothetical protein
MANDAQEPPKPSSTIVVDEEHRQFERQDGSRPPVYMVRAGAAIELDASGYTFPIKADYGVSGPNLILVLMGRDRKYRLQWKQGVHKYVLSKDTLKPEPGSAPFSGFRPGETFSVVVTFEDPAVSKPSAVIAKILWVCLATAQ